MLDETCDRLRTVFRTGNAMTLPISGTGSAGMEAAFVNLVRPGDPVVIGVNGVFGARMCDVAARCGAEVVAVEAPWGRPIDPERAAGGPPRPADHRRRPRRDVDRRRGPTSHRSAQGKGDALLLVDCVTSVGGIEVDVDGWGVDVAYAGTQKCLGVPPGLAPLTRQRPGPRAARRAQPQLVPRPAHDRPVHRPGHRRPHLPPHRAGLDDPVAARRAGRACSTRGSTPPSPATPSAVACCRTGSPSLGLRAVRGRGPPAARADHRVGARGRRRRQGAGGRCSTATASRSAAGSASSPAGCGASAAWATPPGPATSRCCSAALAELMAGR